MANAWDGPEAVRSLSLASKQGLEVDINVDNLFGVKVPRVEPHEFSHVLPLSPVGARTQTLAAAEQFSLLTEALVQVAATETRLRRFGAEITATSRWVNALAHVV